MVTERQACHHTPVTAVDELWYGVEAVWSSVPVHAIQSPFESMPSVITAIGGCFCTVISGSMHPNFLKI
ncbi:hypothetical protein TNCV_2735811 [Trichonephila clavipes]|nr:hypothetical protein TNCV_2735811 [Trichonephila clavipes]